MRQVTRDEPGLRRIRRGSGFEYRTATGAHIVDDIERSRIRSLAIPPAWNDVWICCDSDGHIQARGIDQAGRTQYIYHEQWTRAASEAKFDRMLQLAAALPAARRSVTHDLRTHGTDRSGVLAAGFRMLDTAYVRIGSERYAAEHGSIGLTTLRGSHVTVDDSQITLRFHGKGGVPWESRIDDADLAAVLTSLRQRGPRRRLLAWKDGARWHIVRATDINADVRARTGGDFTAKDFRTLHGTATAAASLARAGVAATASGRKKSITAAVHETAAALGNTPAIARGSYIDPRVFEKFDRGLTVDISGRSIEAQLPAFFAAD